MKSLREQFCHYEANHILSLSITKDHLGKTSLPSFYGFVLRQKCKGVILKKSESVYEFKESLLSSQRLSLPLRGGL